MSSVKTDMNPSDIGTKTLGRERFHRLGSLLGMGKQLSETSSPGTWYSGDESLCDSQVWWIGQRSTLVSKRRFLVVFSVQRGTPRESNTASRRDVHVEHL